MKKETTIAIILGILTGIIMAILIIVNSNKASNPSMENNITQPPISPNVQFKTKNNNPLLISSPAQNSISTSPTITMSGNCSKNALLIFHSSSFEHVIKTDSTTFSTTVTLRPGENSFKITQLVNKTVDSRDIIIYYLPQ